MKAPTAPEVCFRGLFGDIVQGLLAKETEATESAMMATFLAYGSHAMGAKPTVINGEYEHPLTLWFAIIGKSSLGQKGESHRMSAKIWHRAFPELYDEDSPFFAEGYPQSGASLIGTIDEAQTEAIELGLHPAPIGFNWLVLEEEVADLLDRCKRDKKLGVQTRKAWDGRLLRHGVKKNSNMVITKIKNPKVVILAHGSPGEWQRTVGPEDIAGGTVNRFLFCASESDTELPSGGKLDQRKVLVAVNEVRKYIARARAHGPIYFDEGATKAWVHAYREINGMLKADDEVSNLIGRAKAYALRLAAMFALTTTPLEDEIGRPIKKVSISAEDLESAMAWIRYSAASVEYAMGAKVNSVRSPLATKILHSLATYGEHNAQELQRRVGGRVTAPQIKAAVIELGNEVSVYKNPTATGGRRGVIYCLTVNLPDGVDVVDLRESEKGEDGEVVLQGDVIKSTTVATRPQRPASPPRQPRTWTADDDQGDDAPPASRPSQAHLRLLKVEVDDPATPEGLDDDDLKALGGFF